MHSNRVMNLLKCETNEMCLLELIVNQIKITIENVIILYSKKVFLLCCVVNQKKKIQTFLQIQRNSCDLASFSCVFPSLLSF